MKKTNKSTKRKDNDGKNTNNIENDYTAVNQKITKIEEIEVGFKLLVLYPPENKYYKAEILGVKYTEHYEFYIHYLELNKRCDRWVKDSDLKLDGPIEQPKRRRIKRTDDEAKKYKAIRKNILEDKEEEKKEVDIKNIEDKMKNIQYIQMGNKKIEAWYFSPYPECLTNSVVYICEFCLFYFNQEQFQKHDCKLFHPPGNEIYRDEKLSFFEVDGHIQKNYCRNISLLSKLFLDHKTVYYDVDPFMFYVLCRYENDGYKIVGYFSKEKVSTQGYNLACILVLPQYQRLGYGKFLMDFSYVLSRRENKIASPEKPLSDLGLIGYLSYWKDVILQVLIDNDNITINNLSKITFITKEDIILTLLFYKLIKIYDNQIIFLVPENIKPRKNIVNEKCLIWTGNEFTDGSIKHL
ncbi:Histone acetyltransferase SAS2 [Spraguea lophii 42_110]|uniref:Histone acetyltransferase n=1 Tax=Spraguea lophii (strain 42_110) TaxID=1358809 RepID=S7XVL7_SPRLO|nr:Histone acetyltransferase SAS2 [Spraguea lophii 42_110]